MCLPASIARVMRSARIWVVAASKKTVSSRSQGGVEIAGRTLDPVFMRDCCTRSALRDQDRVRYHPVAIRERHAGPRGGSPESSARGAG